MAKDFFAVSLSLGLHGLLLFTLPYFFFKKAHYSVTQDDSSIAMELMMPFQEEQEIVSSRANPISSSDKKAETSQLQEEIIPINKTSSKEKKSLASDRISHSKTKRYSSGKNQTTFVSSQGSPSQAQPDYLKNPVPPYPELSRRLKEEGTVWLKTHVSAEGFATQVIILKSSGFKRLDQTAESSVRQWRFQPARFAGRAVDSVVEIPVIFQLK